MKCPDCACQNQTQRKQHTPGPWTVEANSDLEIRGDAFTGWKWVASLTKDGVPFCGEREANANLIAAAPELLDALKTLHLKAAIAARTLPDTKDRSRAMRQLGEELWVAPSVIAKAEGWNK